MPSMRFTGKYEELREKLRGLDGSGDWTDLNENQKQFRHRDGSILNWYPSTGTILFQGPGDARAKLEQSTRAALLEDSASSPVPVADNGPSGGKLVVNVAGSKTGSPSVPATAKTVTQPEPTRGNHFLGQKYSESELVIGLVGAVGTDLRAVIKILEDRLKAFKYESVQVRVSSDIISQVIDPASLPAAAGGTIEFQRISRLMDAGNEARRKSQDHSVLALGIAAKISAARQVEAGQRKPFSRKAIIIDSLKHPYEVARLREIYPEGFYLIGVHSDEKRRHEHLTQGRRMTTEEAEQLMRRDEDEHLSHGQRTSDTFHLSDFFVRIDGNQDQLEKSIWRVLDILFGHPNKTPTFDEYAMFMAFSASLRSADLSRQVGAVVARNNEIIATGANDCPKFGGGLYWAEYDKNTHQVIDAVGGRDYMRGEDANKAEQVRIVEDILTRAGDSVKDLEALKKAIRESRLADITEYGRMVHAEMEALLAIARSNVSAVGATLYATTFPCHNCAKHIVAAGVERVVFIEPYPKSKAAELHSDAISLGFSEDKSTVHFEPFVGVGPRRFFDLFSMRHGSGWPLKRKDADGQALKCNEEQAKLRIQMLPCSYIDLELVASTMFEGVRLKKEGKANG